MNQIDSLSKKLDCVFESAIAEATLDAQIEKLTDFMPKNEHPIDCDSDDYDPNSLLDEYPESNVTVKQEETAIATQIEGALAIRDYDTMRGKLIATIEKSTRVVDKVVAELDSVQSGNSPKMFDSYANVTNALSRQIAELRELAKLQLGADVLQSSEKQKKEKDNEKIELTPAQLLRMIKEGQKENEISAEPAEFSEVRS